MIEKSPFFFFSLFQISQLCVDALPKLGTNLNFAFVIFDHPPEVVENLHVHKAANICNRLISISV